MLASWTTWVCFALACGLGFMVGWNVCALLKEREQ